MEKKYGVNISYKEDPYPLSDTGAFKQSYPESNNRVILANADEIRKGIIVYYD